MLTPSPIQGELPSFSYEDHRIDDVSMRTLSVRFASEKGYRYTGCPVGRVFEFRDYMARYADPSGDDGQRTLSKTLDLLSINISALNPNDDSLIEVQYPIDPEYLTEKVREITGDDERVVAFLSKDELNEDGIYSLERVQEAAQKKETLVSLNDKGHGFGIHDIGIHVVEGCFRSPALFDFLSRDGMDMSSHDVGGYNISADFFSPDAWHGVACTARAYLGLEDEEAQKLDFEQSAHTSLVAAQVDRLHAERFGEGGSRVAFAGA